MSRKRRHRKNKQRVNPASAEPRHEGWEPPRVRQGLRDFEPYYMLNVQEEHQKKRRLDTT